ncbi:MAG: adenylosuccinate synthetase [Candidatus Saccharimonadales bacterium]
MPITVIEGEQRGDEGKGRFVDMLMPDFDIGARFNGGDNAGHTVVAPDGEVYKLHGLPTSIVHEHATSVIGNGTAVNPLRLTGEIETLREQGISISADNFLLSGGAHLTLPHYILQDEQREQGKDAQGSTKSGIAQVYGAKAERRGVRAEIINNDPDKLFEIVLGGLQAQSHLMGRVSGRDQRINIETAKEYVDRAKLLGTYVTDTVLYVNQELSKDKPARVLAEGAQAFLLDIDHGMYPYVTSSTTTVGGVLTGLGVSHKHVKRVIGVSKAIQSHVGGGPFVTEIHDPYELQELHGDMSAVDAECGTTTGRVRRLGHLDLPQIRRSQKINGTDEMALTKLDWVSRYSDEIPVCTTYERKGKVLDIAPDAAYKLDQSTPQYAHLPNWTEDIQHIRRFEDLPQNAQHFIKFIEQVTNVRVSMIGVGPRRDQVIVR